MLFGVGMGIGYWQKSKGMGSNFWREFFEDSNWIRKIISQITPPPWKKTYYIYEQIQVQRQFMFRFTCWVKWGQNNLGNLKLPEEIIYEVRNGGAQVGTS